MQDCKEEYPGDRLLGPLHGAPGAGDVRVADVDIALHRQRKRQPDRRGVEDLEIRGVLRRIAANCDADATEPHLRHGLHHRLVGVSRLLALDRASVAKGVVVEVPAQ